jgi:hypothetical protein
MKGGVMGRFLASGLAAVALAASGARAQEVQLLSPDITFTAREVFFRDPVTYVGRDGRPHTARTALKLLLKGKDFYEGATGPFYYLGRRRANAHYTSPDGRWVAVYFYDLRDLPTRAPLLIETGPSQSVTLKQSFDLRKVRRLDPALRRRYGLDN